MYGNASSEVECQFCTGKADAPVRKSRPFLTACAESRLSLGRRMTASVGRRATDSRTERGTGVALAARWLAAQLAWVLRSLFSKATHGGADNAHARGDF